MNVEQAIKQQNLTQPCFYVGRLNYLTDKPFYIKQVAKETALVSPDIEKLDYNECHQLALKHLITEDEYKIRQSENERSQT